MAELLFTSLVELHSPYLHERHEGAIEKLLRSYLVATPEAERTGAQSSLRSAASRGLPSWKRDREDQLRACLPGTSLFGSFKWQLLSEHGRV
jgi:hypothetical protein